MDEKLTEEEKQSLMQRVAEVMEEDVLRKSDAVELIDVLLNACKRERELLSDVIPPVSGLQQ